MGSFFIDKKFIFFFTAIIFLVGFISLLSLLSISRGSVVINNIRSFVSQMPFVGKTVQPQVSLKIDNQISNLEITSQSIKKELAILELFTTTLTEYGVSEIKLTITDSLSNQKIKYGSSASQVYSAIGYTKVNETLDVKVYLNLNVIKSFPWTEPVLATNLENYLYEGIYEFLNSQTIQVDGMQLEKNEKGQTKAQTLFEDLRPNYPENLFKATYR